MRTSAAALSAHHAHRRRAASLRRCAAMASPAAEAGAPPVGQMKLYSTPLSNYGARVTLLLKWKGITEEEVSTRNPSELGGLKSERYLALHPQGKMPLLVLASGRGLPESEVIVSYLMDVFEGRGAAGKTLRLATPEARATAALVTRLHDVYLGPHQPAMYRAMDAAVRAAAIAEIARQLNFVEAALDEAGPFAAGQELSTGDAALFPTFCFYTFILPRVFGWKDVFAGRPKLARWWAALCGDTDAAEVRQGITSAQEQWEADGRWKKLGIEEQVADPNSTFVWAY